MSKQSKYKIIVKLFYSICLHISHTKCITFVCIVVEFHGGLHCLPKNLFAGTCIQNERVDSSMISFGTEAAPTPSPQIMLGRVFHFLDFFSDHLYN